MWSSCSRAAAVARCPPRPTPARRSRISGGAARRAPSSRARATCSKSPASASDRRRRPERERVRTLGGRRRRARDLGERLGGSEPQRRRARGFDARLERRPGGPRGPCSRVLRHDGRSRVSGRRHPRDHERLRRRTNVILERAVDGIPVGEVVRLGALRRGRSDHGRRFLLADDPGRRRDGRAGAARPSRRPRRPRRLQGALARGSPGRRAGHDPRHTDGAATAPFTAAAVYDVLERPAGGQGSNHDFDADGKEVILPLF